MNAETDATLSPKPEFTPRVGTTALLWIVAAIALAALFAWIYLPRLPPSAACTSPRCIEGREWFSVLVTLAVVAGGIFQYRKAQLWKRSEWIANETKSFLDDPMAVFGLKMLDWNRRRLPYLPGELPGSDLYFEYTSALLDTALFARTTIPKLDNGADRPFTPEERAVRDYLDRMLDKLERFEIFIENDLVSFKELHPYLEYWTMLIGNKSLRRKSPERMEMLWLYIHEYRFFRVQNLCKRFGYDITPSKYKIGDSDVPPPLSSVLI